MALVRFDIPKCKAFQNNTPGHYSAQHRQSANEKVDQKGIERAERRNNNQDRYASRHRVTPTSFGKC